MAKYQGKNSTYEFTIDKTKNVFHAQASGFFSLEDGTSFIKDYDQLTKTFATEDYNLIINAAELKPSSPEVANILGELLGKYMSVPFKSRFLITKGSAVTMSQFKRLGKQIPGWTESVQYLDEFDDAIQKIS